MSNLWLPLLIHTFFLGFLRSPDQKISHWKSRQFSSSNPLQISKIKLYKPKLSENLYSLRNMCSRKLDLRMFDLRILHLWILAYLNFVPKFSMQTKVSVLTTKTPPRSELKVQLCLFSAPFQKVLPTHNKFFHMKTCYALLASISTYVHKHQLSVKTRTCTYINF